MNYSFLLFQSFLIMFFSGTVNPARSTEKEADRILGKWMTEQKNLIVEVYKEGIEYKARILWFNDSDDRSRPMDIRTDLRNQNPELRSRKLIGLDVLKLLTYHRESNTWENGVIYDALSGKEWSSYAYLTENGTLRVKGFWHFKFLSKSLDFTKIN